MLPCVHRGEENISQMQSYVECQIYHCTGKISNLTTCQRHTYRQALEKHA